MNGDLHKSGPWSKLRGIGSLVLVLALLMNAILPSAAVASQDAQRCTRWHPVRWIIRRWIIRRWHLPRRVRYQTTAITKIRCIACPRSAASRKPRCLSPRSRQTHSSRMASRVIITAACPHSPARQKTALLNRFDEFRVTAPALRAAHL